MDYIIVIFSFFFAWVIICVLFCGYFVRKARIWAFGEPVNNQVRIDEAQRA